MFAGALYYGGQCVECASLAEPLGKGVFVSFRERNRGILASVADALGRDTVPYELSLACRESAYFVLVRRGLDRLLLILAGGGRAQRVTRLFDGEPGPQVTLGKRTLKTLVCQRTHKNALGLRTTFAHLRPRPLGIETSFGMGDRLGLATPGHAAVCRRYGVTPILAQQSIREMSRTGRTPENVMDDATWGAFQVGYAGVLGSDADHLKTAEDIGRCNEAGFTMFTIDPGEYVGNDADTLDAGALRQRFEALCGCTIFKNALGGKRFDFPEAGFSITFDDETLARSAVKYAGAVDHVEKMFRHVESVCTGGPFEVEVSVDETATPTTAADHVFVASELKRRGVAFVGLAPRFVGSFEKAIDYAGDIGEFRREFAKHASIARALGPYKLSIHSGSDKFSVFPIVADLAGGLVHEKTAGTSYLEAIRVVAAHNADLYRRIHALALDRFVADRASYQLTTDTSVIPALDALADDELAGLLDERNVRQLIHVTYGSVLQADGGALRNEISATLIENEDEHYDALGRHMARHIELLGMGG